MEGLPWLTMISVLILSFQLCLVFVFAVRE